MNIAKPNIAPILSEIKFTTSRSGGPGGQSVNKLNTRVTLRWDVVNSLAIDAEQSAIILDKLKRVINKDGAVILTSDASRSQLQNKETVVSKLEILLEKAFTVAKKRKPTKPTKASVKRRLDDKRHLAIKKKQRRDLE